MCFHIAMEASTSPISEITGYSIFCVVDLKIKCSADKQNCQKHCDCIMAESDRDDHTSYYETTPTSNEDVHYHNILGYNMFMVLFATVAVIICFANIMVLTVICRSRKLHTKTNLLMGSMASGDLGMGLTMPSCFMPYYILSSSNSDKATAAFCLTCTCLNVIFLVSSITSLLCVNAERYVKIVHPFRYELVITKLMVVAMVSSSWLTALTFGCLLLIENTWKPDGQSICTLAATASLPLLYAGAIYSVLTLVTFAYFSGRVIHTARKQRHMIQALEGCISANAANERKKDNHLAKMFVLIGVFYLLMVPYIGLAVYASLLGAPSSKLFNTLEILSCLIAYMNACVSPAIYVYKDVVFRRELKKLTTNFRKRLSRDRQNEITEMTSTVVHDY